VYAVLAFQVSVCVIAFYLHRYCFDAGFIAVQQVADGHPVVPGFSPAHVHTHQHGRPVLAFRTSGARIYFQDATHLIRFFTEHVAKLKVFDQFLRFCIGTVYLFFACDTFFNVFISQLKLSGRIAHLLIEFNPFLETFHHLHVSFGPPGIFPEYRILGT
jgi:hypothetical protein